MTLPALSDSDLLRRWIVARARLTLRTQRTVFFTFVFPLMFLLLFGALNSGSRVAAARGAGGDVPFAQFYTPSIGIFGLTMACYSGVIAGLSAARESGLLKRVRGTPLPMPVYLASWLSSAALTGMGAVVLMFAVAVPAFGVHLYLRLLPAAVATLVLSAACLAALGLAVASLVRNAEQAMPVAQITFLPLSFISGIFYPLDGAPSLVLHIAKIFPLFHIVQAFDACFEVQTPGGGWAWSHLAVIAAWGAAGLVVAARRFRWEPSAGEGRSRRLGRRRTVTA